MSTDEKRFLALVLGLSTVVAIAVLLRGLYAGYVAGSIVLAVVLIAAECVLWRSGEEMNT